MSTTPAPPVWATMWRPLAALGAAAAAATYLAIPVFDDLIEVYFFLLVVAVLAACSLRLARDAWRWARRQDVGRPATSVTAAATVVSGVVSLTLIVAVVVTVLGVGGGG